MKVIERFVRDERGSTAIEYGLIASLICIAVIASMTSLGSNLSDTWNKIQKNVAIK